LALISNKTPFLVTAILREIFQAVKNDGRVQGSANYFYTEEAPLTTYDNFLIATAEGNTRQTQ
jgi:hypothetical protein